MKTPTVFNCRSCGAHLIWAETITGRRMPLDITPTKDGNIILGLRDQQAPLALVQTQQQLERLRAKGELLYVCHFATCPQHKKWRRSGTRE
jgi:hypothetical protein